MGDEQDAVNGFPTEERKGFTFRIPCDDCESDGVNFLVGCLVLCQSCVTERFKRARERVRSHYEQ